MRDAREKAMTQVRERTDSARQSATRMVDERKRTLAESVHALASAFDAAANSLNEGQQGRLAEWTRELSGRAHRMASYLDEQNTGALVNDIEDSARRHPAAFLGTTFAAGLAAGRFLRATQRTDTGIAPEGSVDFDFHPDAALLADDRSEAASFGGSTTGSLGLSATDRESLGGGYGNPGTGYGTTGSSVGSTRSGLGDQGFGPTVTGPNRGLSGAGHIGTGGAALASRAAGSAPIGSGTGGLNQGGAIGDKLNSTDPNDARELLDATRDERSASSRGTTGGTAIDSGTNSDESSNPQRPGGREGGV
ncbi:MAG TPA: hypothetical protein VF039_06040 [Longimicrobiales bacterium]